MVQFIQLVKKLTSSVQPIERKVGEDTLRFYPITPGDLYLLRSLSAALAEAFGLLFTARGNKATQRDSESLFRNVKTAKTSEDDDSGGEINETVTGAISVELATLRTQQATDAYKKIANLITDRENMEILAKIILSSLRAEDREDPMAAVEMTNVPLPIFLKLVGGMLDASSDSMGQLGKDIGRVLRDGIAPVNSDPQDEDGQTKSQQTEGT